MLRFAGIRCFRSVIVLPPPPPHLNFPVASTKVGRPYALAEHCVVDPDIACRELIQNSLDAHSALQDEEPCRVTFKVSKIEVSDIPGYAEYQEALDKAKFSWRNKDEVTAYLTSMQAYLDERELDILYVIDNGKGFDENGLEAVMAEGSPDKQEGSTGSFGVGHLTTYGISGIQYVCYASKQLNGTFLATGHAILSSHDSNGKLHSNNGYYVENYEPKFDKPFTFCAPEYIPDFLCKELDLIETSGSIVAVLGFNGFRQGIRENEARKKKLHELIREAIAENFAIAIWGNHLEVEVFGPSEDGNLLKGDGASQAMLPEIMDRKSIKNFLEHMAREDTGTKEQTLKARQTIDAIETYENYSSKGNLPGPFQDCKVNLRNRARRHNVSIWRNGMLITRTHRGLAKSQFDNKKPFDAVITLSGKVNPCEAHDIVKAAETPMHDKIQERRLPDRLSKQKLKKWFEVVREWISSHAEESGGQSADLEDEIILDGGNVMEAKLRRQPKTFVDQESKGVPEPAEARGQEKGRSSIRGKQLHVPRRLTRIKAQGKVLANQHYRLRIKPDSQITNGYLKVVIDSGQDPSCTGVVQDTFLIIKTAKSPQPGGQTYSVSDGLIRVGNLEKDDTTIIDLAFANPPENLGQISLSCLLGSIEGRE